MPLNPRKTKKAFNENVATEIRAGKPRKQAVAIGYAELRRPKKKGGRKSK